MSEQNAKCTANAVPAKNTAAKSRSEKREGHKVKEKVATSAAKTIAEHMAEYDKHTDKATEATIAEADDARRTEANAPYVAIAERYAKYYPSAGEFHITSDRMVFLPGDKAEAEAHQRLLGKGELRTIKVH